MIIKTEISKGNVVDMFVIFMFPFLFFVINDLIQDRLQNTNQQYKSMSMNYKLFLKVKVVLLIVFVFVEHSQQQQLNLYMPVQQGKQIEFQLPKLFNSKQLVMVSPLISQQKINHHLCLPFTKQKATYQQLSSISRNSQDNGKQTGYQIQYDMQKLFTMGNHLDSLYVEDWSKLVILLKDQSLEIYSILSQPSSIKFQKNIKFSQQLKNPMLIKAKIKKQNFVYLISQNKLFQIKNNGEMIQINGFQSIQEQIMDVELHQENLYLATSSKIHLYKLNQNKLQTLLDYKIELTENDLTSIEEFTVDSVNSLLYVYDNQQGIVTVNMLDLATAKKSIRGYVAYDSSSNCRSLTVYKNNLFLLCPNLVVLSTDKIKVCMTSSQKNCTNHDIVSYSMSLGYYGKQILMNESQIVIVGHKKYEHFYPIFDNKTTQLNLIMRAHEIEFNGIIQNSFINKKSLFVLTQTTVSQIVTIPEKIFIRCKTDRLQSTTFSSFSGKLSGIITISGSCSDILKNYTISNYQVREKNICDKKIPLTLQISAPIQQLKTIEQILIFLVLVGFFGMIVYFSIKGIKLIKRMKQYKNLIEQVESGSNKSKRITTEENAHTEIQQQVVTKPV